MKELFTSNQISEEVKNCEAEYKALKEVLPLIEMEDFLLGKISALGDLCVEAYQLGNTTLMGKYVLEYLAVCKLGNLVPTGNMLRFVQLYSKTIA